LERCWSISANGSFEARRIALSSGYSNWEATQR
jgi:hypothetical protein